MTNIVTAHKHSSGAELVLKWAAEHPQRWKEIRSKANRTYYERNREQILMKKKMRLAVQINGT
jgi:hypothetical protein